MRRETPPKGLAAPPSHRRVSERAAVEQSKIPSTPKPRPRRKRCARQPWNDPDVHLELYVSPTLKGKLGLSVKTTPYTYDPAREDDEPRKGAR